jgi:hypothetical protein
MRRRIRGDLHREPVGPSALTKIGPSVLVKNGPPLGHAMQRVEPQVSQNSFDVGGFGAVLPGRWRRLAGVASGELATSWVQHATCRRRGPGSRVRDERSELALEAGGGMWHLNRCLANVVPSRVPSALARANGLGISRSLCHCATSSTRESSPVISQKCSPAPLGALGVVHFWRASVGHFWRAPKVGRQGAC